MELLLDLLREVGIEPKKKSTTQGGEYASPCPRCSGQDRFISWPHKTGKKVSGSYWCRRCNSKGDSIQFCRDFLGMSYQQALNRCQVSDNTIQKRIYPVYNSLAEDFRANPKWKDAITELCQEAVVEASKTEPVLKYLASRGIPSEAMAHYMLGFLSVSRGFPRDFLGLPKEDGKPNINISSGITIPTVEKGKVVRLKVRDIPWGSSSKRPKYQAITGSLKGMNLIGDRSKDILIAVEAELDAYATHWATREEALVIAVGGNTKCPDQLTHYLCKKSRRLIVIPDKDEGGEFMWNQWKGYYSHAEKLVLPYGKDIGEAIQKGLDFSDLLKKILLG